HLGAARENGRASPPGMLSAANRDRCGSNPMMILRAILFDLDDTIITEGERLPILVQVAEEMADSLAPHSPAVVAHALEIAFQSFCSTPARARLARLGAASGIRQARETIVADTFRS